MRDALVIECPAHLLHVVRDLKLPQHRHTLAALLRLTHRLGIRVSPACRASQPERSSNGTTAPRLTPILAVDQHIPSAASRPRLNPPGCVRLRAPRASAMDGDEGGPPRWDARRVTEERVQGGPSS